MRASTAGGRRVTNFDGLGHGVAWPYTALGQTLCVTSTTRYGVRGTFDATHMRTAWVSFLSVKNRNRYVCRGTSRVTRHKADNKILWALVKYRNSGTGLEIHVKLLIIILPNSLSPEGLELPCAHGLSHGTFSVS